MKPVWGKWPEAIDLIRQNKAHIEKTYGDIQMEILMDIDGKSKIHVLLKVESLAACEQIMAKWRADPYREGIADKFVDLFEPDEVHFYTILE